MKLPPNVKMKPSFWNIIPWLTRQTATALYPNIYLPQHIYKDLLKRDPDPYNVALLIHEQTHIKREMEIGWFYFDLKYLFSPTFRVNEEFIAIKEAMKFIKSKELMWNTEKSARYLSGWVYLWPVSYKYAKKTLHDIWKKI